MKLIDIVRILTDNGHHRFNIIELHPGGMPSGDIRIEVPGGIIKSRAWTKLQDEKPAGIWFNLAPLKWYKNWFTRWRCWVDTMEYPPEHFNCRCVAVPIE